MGGRRGRLAWVGLVLSLWLIAFGPGMAERLSPPLAGAAGLAGGLGLIWAGLALWVLASDLRSRRRERGLAALLEAFRGSLPPPGGSGLAEGAGASRTGWGREEVSRDLSGRPWFVVLGPQGAGKSTLLRASGLSLLPGPAGDGLWLSQEAVCLSAAPVPAGEAWQRLLTGLRRLRQPVSGVVLVVSPAAISMTDQAGREALAAAFRARITELSTASRRSLPVWLLLSRLDQIPGFRESLSQLPQGLRAAECGIPVMGGQGPPEARVLSAFEAGFDRLLAQLADAAPGRLAAEAAPGARSLIVDFPNQLAVLRVPLRGFLTVLTRSGPDPAPEVQGIWLTAAGGAAPLRDGPEREMRLSFGLGPQPLAAPRPVGARDSWFVRGFFRRVLLPAGARLAGARPPERRSGRVAALTLAAGAGLWLLNVPLVPEGQRAARSTEAAWRAAALLRPAATGLQGDPLGSLLPGLGLLASRSETAAGEGGPAALMAGLAYRAALNQRLRPALLQLAEAELHAARQDPAALQAALRVYLMLAAAAPVQAEAVTSWLHAHLSAALPGGGGADLLPELSRHVTALLRQPMPRMPLNGDLVADLRGQLSRRPEAERLYHLILATPAARALPDPDVLAEVPAAAAHLQRSHPERRIPGLYSPRGLEEVMLPWLSAPGELLQQMFWLSGAEAAPVAEGQAFSALRRDVLGLYFAAYIRHYEEELQDLNLRLPPGGADPPERADATAGPLSPPQGAGVMLSGGGEVPALRAVLQRIAEDTFAGAAPGEPGAVVAARFRPLHQALAGGPPVADPVHGPVLRVPAGQNVMPLSLWSRQQLDGQPQRRAVVSEAWRQQVLPLCEALTGGIYPFRRVALSEATPQQMRALFGPEGAIARFEAAYLSADPATAFAPAALADLQRAEEIRRAFFGAPPQLRLLRTDPEGQVVILRSGETEIRLRPGDMAEGLRSTGGPVRLAFEGGGAGPEFSGPWALLRLLAVAEPRRGAGGQLGLVYRIGGKTAVLAVQSAAGEPFPPVAALRAFRCPQTF